MFRIPDVFVSLCVNIDSAQNKTGGVLLARVK